MRLRPGLRPGPAGGTYSAPPDPLAGFKGGGEEEGREGRRREKKERGREGGEREWRGG